MTKQKPAQPTTHEKLSLDGNYPGLNGFKYAIGYLEQALNIASEPLLAACFVIAVIDVMTGGHLMDIELISYTWATALALAVTANFIITWRRSATALHLNRYGTSITLAILGVLLGIVDCAALAIKGLQQMLNIPFAQALTWLYLNPVLMVYIRSIVAVSILVVVALSNHLAITTAQAPKRRLAIWDKALNKLAPVVSDEQSQGAQAVSTPNPGPEVEQIEASRTEQEVEQHINMVKARLAVNTSNARAKNLGLPNDLTVEQWVGLLETTEGCCSYCDTYIGINHLTLDHILPVSRGGASTLENIAPACLTCNQRKGRYDKEPGSFLEQDRNNLKFSIIHNVKSEKIERVRQVLKDKPACSLRELGRLSGLSAATAKKYKTLIEQECLQAG